MICSSIKNCSSLNRVLVIGLDCAEPDLVFNQFSGKLPNLEALMQEGVHGKLKSTDPPLTIPAWSAMMSGCDPGQLGLYGIRNRTGYSYDKLAISSADQVHEPRIWDILSAHDKPVIALAVPQTYPVRPVNGALVAGMLAPDTTSNFTFPEVLKYELLDIAPNYRIDIENFRQMKPADLLDQIQSMTQARFKAFTHLIQTRPWDFAMMVEIGLDRLQHGFWQYVDKNHPLYPGPNQFESAIEDYYINLDTEIGRLLEIVPSDTAVFIVSDHGAQAMQGGIRINQLLQDWGYLHLKEQPKSVQELDWNMIDWQKTTAWGEGGYLGRVYFNIEGREPQGILSSSRVNEIRQDIIRKLAMIDGPGNESIVSKIVVPEQRFKVTNGYPPDLMVYFGNLRWRALSDVGADTVFTVGNNRGPDGANHADHGIVITNLPASKGSEHKLKSFDILDIAPSILTLLKIPVPSAMSGSYLIEEK